MYIDTIPNRHSPPAILLRESYREQGKVKKRTIANLSRWSKEKLAILQSALSGTPIVSPDAISIVRSLPHGAVAAVLATIKRLQLDTVIAARRGKMRDLVVALIASRIIAPASKLATARQLTGSTAVSTLGAILHLSSVSDDDCYRAMDWLVNHQESIENRLSKKHLAGQTLLLYDLTSVYLEGTHCPLACLGHSRDGKKGSLQIVVGLLCNREGIPISVMVYPGNTADATTLAGQVENVQKRFGIQEIIIVGDRGTITAARIREDLAQTEGVGWITALTAPEVKTLLHEGTLQLSLFDERDLAEIESPSYPGERLICCRNPFLARQRSEKRESLLAATEKELAKVKAAVSRIRRPLRGKAAIGLRVGKVLGRYKMGKHFTVAIEDRSFSYQRHEEKITEEASLDGIYVIRTSITHDLLSSSDTVARYKDLAHLERAFRSMKTVDLHIRPVFHYSEERVRAHAFLCTLAYYVEWHMKKLLSPLLFEDEEKEKAQQFRSSIVAKAVRSDSAKRKDNTKKTDDNLPVHSFRTLLADLATITRNRIRINNDPSTEFERVTIPTPVQKKTLDLLGISL